MVTYWVKTPQWLKKLFQKGVLWTIPVVGKAAVYLTFDDGPHPSATSFVLDELTKYSARGTFFCVGDNVRKYPDIYERINKEGHLAGNHTYNHISGWKNSNDVYLKNIVSAAQLITPKIFRPPYGRIKLSQIRKLRQTGNGWKIYMWDVLCADFDRNITPQQCLDNVLNNIKPGSIVVFHDSDKAWERMNYALPLVLQYCKDQGWEMNSLPE